MNGAVVYIMVVWVGRTRCHRATRSMMTLSLYAGGATDFTRGYSRWDGGGGGEWAGRNDEVDEDR